MHVELSELSIHYNNALPFSQECIYGEEHCAMPPPPVPLLILPSGKKEQISGAN